MVGRSLCLSSLPQFAASLVLVVACNVGAKSVPAAPAPEGDAVGELLGDLMFHADLMSTLDHLCPARAAARDWRSVIRTLPVSARTPELRELSRRLSADAAQTMVRASGGCATPQYAQVYAATRNEYESLMEQWAQLSV